MADEAQIGGTLDRIATNGAMLNQQVGRLITALNDLLPFSGAYGSFTCDAAATTTVTEPSVQTNSRIILIPTNAAAGTLMGSNESLYISARTAATSFQVATAAGTAAAGTETFEYVIINPTT